MSNPFGSFPFDAAGVDSYAHPQCITPYPLRAPTSQDIYPTGTIWPNTGVSPVVLYITSGGGVWNAFGGSGDILSSLTVVGPTTLTGTTNINTTGSSVTTIGTGGTGAVNIGNTTGNTAVTGSLTASTGLVATTGGVTATAGGITATAGNITATNGNVALSTAGNKIVIATGSNASVGTSAAMSGTPGAVTVATTASSATAKVFYARDVAGGTLGNVSITAQDGTGFTLTSTGNETSTFNWWIINN